MRACQWSSAGHKQPGEHGALDPLDDGMGQSGIIDEPAQFIASIARSNLSSSSAR